VTGHLRLVDGKRDAGRLAADLQPFLRVLPDFRREDRENF
jgi:hypothetical protein